MHSKAPPKATVQFSYHGRDITFIGSSENEYIFDQINRSKTFYEEDLLESVSYLGLEPGQTVIDVGANIGNHTVYLAAVMKLDVIAFEPEPTNAMLLSSNVYANHVSELVTIHEVALGDADRTVGLIQNIAENSGTFQTSEDIAGDTLVRRLDDMLDPDLPIALI